MRALRDRNRDARTHRNRARADGRLTDAAYQDGRVDAYADIGKRLARLLARW